jgi:putative ABC transport system permease protein
VATRLAVASLRHRPAGFVAAFLATGLGATILMGFSSMLDVATAPGVDDTSDVGVGGGDSAETLVTMAAVAGGWCLLIVVFAVASTLTLTVSQRAEEMALLKLVGATPRQLRRVVVGEALAVALVACTVAVLPGMAVGRLLLRLLQDTDQVAPGVTYRFGGFALSQGFGVTLLGVTVAAFLAARRAARLRARAALVDAVAGETRIGPLRLLAALVFLAAALSCAVVTATAMSGEDTDAMQTAGQASIWASIGLALLAPPVLRAAVWLLGGLLVRVGGPSGWLTVQNLRSRSRHHAAAVLPIVLFVGISTATIAMQLIENGAVRAAGGATEEFQRTIETLNLVVVGMIALFAAIMLVNTLVAATAHRRREFAQQRLAGATPRQVVATVAAECLVLAGTGVVLGAVASLATVVPFGLARADGSFGDASAAVYPGVAAAAVLVTLGTGLAAARRAVRPPAVSAVAV